MFNYLTGYARPSGYREVWVAPFNLQEGIVGEIERTIEAHSPEHPARIRMKMNSLLDPPCIRALYRASQAGVEVDLNIRGICALRPGVQGISENIRVVSVVGRFLEHSRIYSFERPDGTADLHRFRRSDAAQPLQPGRAGHPGHDPANRDQLTDSLDRAFVDNTNAWELGRRRRLVSATVNGDPPRDMQTELIERHARRAEEAVDHGVSAAGHSLGRAC